jgi:hypothetical protein
MDVGGARCRRDDDDERGRGRSGGIAADDVLARSGCVSLAVDPIHVLSLSLAPAGDVT